MKHKIYELPTIHQNQRKWKFLTWERKVFLWKYGLSSLLSNLVRSHVMLKRYIKKHVFVIWKWESDLEWVVKLFYVSNVICKKWGEMAERKVNNVKTKGYMKKIEALRILLLEGTSVTILLISKLIEELPTFRQSLLLKFVKKQ